MPSTRVKKPGLAAEPCVMHPDGTVSDAEIWADTLGDDIAPWDTTIEAQIARGTTPSAPTVTSAPMPTRKTRR